MGEEWVGRWVESARGGGWGVRDGWVLVCVVSFCWCWALPCKLAATAASTAAGGLDLNRDLEDGDSVAAAALRHADDVEAIDASAPSPDFQDAVSAAFGAEGVGFNRATMGVYNGTGDTALRAHASGATRQARAVGGPSSFPSGASTLSLVEDIDDAERVSTTAIEHAEGAKREPSFPSRRTGDDGFGPTPSVLSAANGFTTVSTRTVSHSAVRTSAQHQHMIGGSSHHSFTYSTHGVAEGLEAVGSPACDRPAGASSQGDGGSGARGKDAEDLRPATVVAQRVEG